MKKPLLLILVVASIIPLFSNDLELLNSKMFQLEKPTIEWCSLGVAILSGFLTYITLSDYSDTKNLYDKLEMGMPANYERRSLLSTGIYLSVSIGEIYLFFKSVVALSKYNEIIKKRAAKERYLKQKKQPTVKKQIANPNENIGSQPKTTKKQPQVPVDDSIDEHEDDERER